jgi:hypothetical protein
MDIEEFNMAITEKQKRIEQLEVEIDTLNKVVKNLILEFTPPFVFKNITIKSLIDKYKNEASKQK